MFQVSHLCIAQKVKGVLMWNLSHIIFHTKMKILADFQICISVPLREKGISFSKILNYSLYIKLFYSLFTLVWQHSSFQLTSLLFNTIK